MTEKKAGKMPVNVLKGVGPKLQERLARLSIYTLDDLLFHLPLRYQDRSRLLPLGAVRAGDEVQVEGEVLLTEIKYARRRMLVVRISDATGFVNLRFFNFSSTQKEKLQRGAWLRCFGEVRKGNGGLEMVHPEYQFITAASRGENIEQALTPVYPSTEGLHQLGWRKLAEQLVKMLRDGQLEVDELLPQSLLKEQKLPSLKQALLYLHAPPVDAPLETIARGRHLSQRRLILEELLAHHIALRKLRHLHQQHAAHTMQQGELHECFLQQLPFNLTHAQQRVVGEIYRDMAKPVPMQRLVQGDVGSGKTVVAALAALCAVQQGFQVALMAPTEILAEQHWQNFYRWFTPLSISMVSLSSRQKTAQRRQALAAMQQGEARVVVGTHALFQEGVEFKQLGLVIVDEQHRFGVHQRLALREKGIETGYAPHQLIMTATPIPRTLAMTAYADLDCSVIDELPPGRKPVETVVIPDSRRDEVVARVATACQDGRQVYWVCTLIDESEVLQAQAAEKTAEDLQQALAEHRIGLVHGRMKAEEKDAVMQQFKAHQLDILVATTVIEVGVDVPNASLMIMENAERLGLAQLHQLRGRVGRGEQESACVLMYHGNLSQRARQRLSVMRESNDGFVIAEKDLEIRGPGEVLGTRQTGQVQFRIADLQRDQALIPEVASMAEVLLHDYPEQADALLERWVGESGQFVNV